MPDHDIDSILDDIEVDSNPADFYEPATFLDIPSSLRNTIDEILGEGATFDITNRGYLSKYDTTGEQIAKFKTQQQKENLKRGFQSFLDTRSAEIGSSIAEDKFRSRLDRFGISEYNPTDTLKRNLSNLFQQDRDEKLNILQSEIADAIVDETTAIDTLRDEYTSDILDVVGSLQQSGYTPPSLEEIAEEDELFGYTLDELEEQFPGIGMFEDLINFLGLTTDPLPPGENVDIVDTEDFIEQNPTGEAVVDEFSLGDDELPASSGCTDPNASNYNPNATNDDGSCMYPTTPN